METLNAEAIYPPAGGQVRPGRRRRAIAGLETVRSAVGPLPPGVSLIGITHGRFSLVDLLAHTLEQLGGGAQLSVWSLVVGGFEVVCLERFVQLGLLADGPSLILDRSSEQRAPELIDRWRGALGPVRVCFNHSKMLRIEAGGRRVLVRGSMNLNENPRFEQFDLTCGGPEFDLVAAVESRLEVLPAMSSNADATRITGAGVRRSEFPIGKVKAWQK